MPRLVVDITESEAERLAWLAKNLDMAGIQTSDSEIVGVLIMTVQREALENAYKDPGSLADIGRQRFAERERTEHRGS